MDYYEKHIQIVSDIVIWVIWDHSLSIRRDHGIVELSGVAFLAFIGFRVLMINIQL